MHYDRQHVSNNMLSALESRQFLLDALIASRICLIMVSCMSSSLVLLILEIDSSWFAF